VVAAASSTPGAAFSLSASDFVAGKAWINLTNTVAETSTLVATLSSNSAVTSSTAITFNPRSTTLTATVAPTAATTGWRGATTSYTVPQVASVNFTLASGSSTTASFPVTIVDTNGAHTGKVGGKYSRSVAPGGTFTIAATFDGVTSSDDFTVGGAIDNAGANTSDAEFQSTARNFSTYRTDAVDNIFVNNNRISSVNANGDIEVYPNGTGNVVLNGSARITEIGEPVGISDATTKNYVDVQIKAKSLALSMDISDGRTNEQIAEDLESIAPVAEYDNGTVARILCTIVSEVRPTLNLNSYLNESTATFNTPSGTGSALTDVSFSDVDIPTPAYNISRIVKTYQIIANAWSFVVL
jgi:hypothetical protein